MIAEGLGAAFPLDDEAIALQTLIAEITLNDLDHLQTGRKGKEIVTVTSEDEELAFRLFAEEVQDLLTITKDAVFARSLDSALETDSFLIEEVTQAEAVAHSDREFAVALSQGPPPPYRSVATTSSSTSSRGDPVQNLLTTIQEQTGESPSPVASSSGVVPSNRSVTKIRLVNDRKHEICVFCREDIHGPHVRAPCGHFWDRACTVDLFRAATTDESLFPPRCCQQAFVLADVQHHLGAELSSQFSRKSIEFSTVDRIYCHRPTCSSFLGAATAGPTIHTCFECFATTCGHCKESAHPTRPCSVDDAPILALADKEGWKRCPGCRRLVELVQGCYHMTCLCKKQFCYVCTETWKNCTCPQWDEPRLLATAEVQVRRQIPAGLPPAPNQYREMVTRAADRLRVDHDCQHVWKYRPGAGQCENCYHYLGVFLLSCRHCHMNVCARCRRNRL